jgi:hypothetical protein
MLTLSGHRLRDRDPTPPQEEPPQRGNGASHTRQAGVPSRVGRHLLGHGGLFDLSALAQRRPAKPILKPDDGKCLHYYFYFLDEELGLTYVRVPTWLPCRLQIYFNGHNWLAAQLGKRKIAYQLLDNAFVEIGDWKQAQRIADDWKVQPMHRKLDEFAQRLCPIVRHFRRAIPLEPGSKRIRH